MTGTYSTDPMIDQDISYTLKIDAYSRRSFLAGGGQLPVIQVTGDFKTVREVLASIGLDASALAQLERFHRSMTEPIPAPDALPIRVHVTQEVIDAYKNEPNGGIAEGLMAAFRAAGFEVVEPEAE